MSVPFSLGQQHALCLTGGLTQPSSIHKTLLIFFILTYVGLLISTNLCFVFKSAY